MQERMHKIAVAAEIMGVTPKTIYNWLEDGSLQLAHPGFVYMSEVREVYELKQNQVSESRKLRSRLFSRDENGRFHLLSGKLNGKIYKGLVE